MIDDNNGDELPDQRLTRAEIQAAIDQLVAEGKVYISGSRGGKPVYVAVPDKKH